LEEAGIGIDDLTNIVFFEKPFIKFERLLETYVSFAPKGFMSFKQALPLWVKEKLFQKKIIREMMQRFPSTEGENYDWEDKLKFSEHHLSHAASAFYPSPFVSTFAWLTVFSFYLLHRVSCKFRRVQSHGVSTLWRAEVHPNNFR